MEFSEQKVIIYTHKYSGEKNALPDKDIISYIRLLNRSQVKNT